MSGLLFGRRLVLLLLAVRLASTAQGDELGCRYDFTVSLGSESYHGGFWSFPYDPCSGFTRPDYYWAWFKFKGRSYDEDDGLAFFDNGTALDSICWVNRDFTWIGPGFLDRTTLPWRTFSVDVRRLRAVTWPESTPPGTWIRQESQDSNAWRDGLLQVYPDKRGNRVELWGLNYNGPGEKLGLKFVPRTGQAVWIGACNFGKAQNTFVPKFADDDGQTFERILYFNRDNSKEAQALPEDERPRDVYEFDVASSRLTRTPENGSNHPALDMKQAPTDYWPLDPPTSDASMVFLDVLEVELVARQSGEWTYGILSELDGGLPVHPGDRWILRGEGITDASVDGEASRTEYGSWAVSECVDMRVVFEATTAGLLPSDLVSGFHVESAEDERTTNWASLGQEANYVGEVLGPTGLWLPGDANRDGNVDFFDYLIVKANLGRTGMDWRNGDFDGDWDVDRYDLLALQGNFGLRSGELQTPRSDRDVLPEPATLLLICGATAPVLLKRRRSSARRTEGEGSEPMRRSRRTSGLALVGLAVMRLRRKRRRSWKRPGIARNEVD